MTAIAIGHLSAIELHRILATREAWTFITKAFKTGDKHCEECSFMKAGTTRVPYGDTTVPMQHSDCTLGERVGHKPTQCPAWQAHLAAREDEALDGEEPPTPATSSLAL